MFARTKRLTLRPAWPEDAAALTEAIAHESVVTKLARVPWPYSIDHAREFLARPRGHDDVFMLITAIESGTPQLIGGIGIHREGDGFELGYWLTPTAWGRGFATEAGTQMIAIARTALGLRRLQAEHHVDNPASGRVLAKLGFRPTGIEPRFCRARGREVACVRLALELDGEQDVASRMPLAA